MYWSLGALGTHAYYVAATKFVIHFRWNLQGLVALEVADGVPGASVSRRVRYTSATDRSKAGDPFSSVSQTLSYLNLMVFLMFQSLGTFVAGGEDSC